MTDINRLSPQDYYLQTQALQEGESPAIELTDSQKTAISLARLDEAASQVAPKHKFSTAAKVAIGIFTFGIGAAAIAIKEHIDDRRQQKEMASSMNNVKNELCKIQDKDQDSFETNIAGEKVKFSYDRGTSRLRSYISVNGQYHEITMSKGLEQTIGGLEDDILRNRDFYGNDAAADTLNRYIKKTHSRNSADRTLNTYDDMRLRSCCFNILKKECGIDEASFSNLKTDMLLIGARMSLEGVLNPDDFVNNLINPMCNRDQINSEDCLLMLRSLEEQRAVQPTVTMQPGNVNSAQTASGSPLSQDLQNEIKLRNMLADMAFSEETWVHDKLMDKPGERMRAMLLKHSDDLMMLKDNPQVLARLGLNPDDFTPQALAKTMGIEDMLPGSGILAGAALKMINKSTLENIIQNLPADKLVAFENMIDEKINGIFNQVQTMIRDNFDSMMGLDQASGTDSAPASQSAAGTQAQAPAAEGAAPADAAAQAPAAEGEAPAAGTAAAENAAPSNEPTLDTMLDETQSADSPGFGMFLKKAFSRYFTESAAIDKRSMVASYLRGSNSESSIGQQAGALLKGSGPIMQKTLQGVNLTKINGDLRVALADMKSNLAPIPDQIIKAYLNDMVARSNGQISNIEVKRSLGAASVGQALLCTMTKADGSSEDVVVKLLRPDAMNRAKREQDIFLQAASEVPGMKKTFEAQLARIIDEMDLRVESQNIKDGQIYGQLGNNEVKSMQLHDLIEPTANTMVLKKAPGETLEKYTSKVKERALNLVADFLKKDADGNFELDRNGKVQVDPSKPITIYDIENKLKDFEGLYQEVDHSMQSLLFLTQGWVTEGMYRKGFYHGDLHSGNIMLDATPPKDGQPAKSELTVIDFGNATHLTEEQQKYVTQMLSGAAAQKSDIFAKGYKALLSEDGKKLYEDNESEINATIDRVLSLGNAADTGKRIAVLLAKLQQLGLEMPGPIYNFSQCQMRLQGAVEGMGAALTQIKDICAAFCSNAKPVEPFHGKLNIMGYTTGLGVTTKSAVDSLVGAFNQELYATNEKQLKEYNEAVGSLLQDKLDNAQALNRMLSSPNISEEKKNAVVQALDTYAMARHQAGIAPDFNEAKLSNDYDKKQRDLEVINESINREQAKGALADQGTISRLQSRADAVNADLTAMQQQMNDIGSDKLGQVNLARKALVDSIFEAQKEDAAAYAKAASSMLKIQNARIPQFITAVGNVIVQNLSSTFSRLGLIDSLRVRSIQA